MYICDKIQASVSNGSEMKQIQLNWNYSRAVNCLTLRHPRNFTNRKRTRGVDTNPPGFLPSRSNLFENILHGYVFEVKNSNGDNGKFLSSLRDLENRSQTPFCRTFLNSGSKHDTNSILVSILIFPMSRISENPESFTWF